MPVHLLQPLPPAMDDYDSLLAFVCGTSVILFRATTISIGAASCPRSWIPGNVVKLFLALTLRHLRLWLISCGRDRRRSSAVRSSNLRLAMPADGSFRELLFSTFVSAIFFYLAPSMVSACLVLIQVAKMIVRCRDQRANEANIALGSLRRHLNLSSKYVLHVFILFSSAVYWSLWLGLYHRSLPIMHFTYQAANQANLELILGFYSVLGVLLLFSASVIFLCFYEDGSGGVAAPADDENDDDGSGGDDFDDDDGGDSDYVVYDDDCDADGDDVDNCCDGDNDDDVGDDDDDNCGDDDETDDDGDEDNENGCKGLNDKEDDNDDDHHHDCGDQIANEADVAHGSLRRQLNSSSVDDLRAFVSFSLVVYSSLLFGLYLLAFGIMHSTDQATTQAFLKFILRDYALLGSLLSFRASVLFGCFDKDGSGGVAAPADDENDDDGSGGDDYDDDDGGDSDDDDYEDDCNADGEDVEDDDNSCDVGHHDDDNGGDGDEADDAGDEDNQKGCKDVNDKEDDNGVADDEADDAGDEDNEKGCKDVNDKEDDNGVADDEADDDGDEDNENGCKDVSDKEDDNGGDRDEADDDGDEDNDVNDKEDDNGGEGDEADDDGDEDNENGCKDVNDKEEDNDDDDDFVWVE